MAERLLVTQALDERDLLVKRIESKINKLNVTDIKKNNEETTYIYRLSPNEFSKAAQSSYQQILDLISRFRRLDAALTTSNAKTMIHTSAGDFTVAGAIALRSRIMGTGNYGKSGQFEYSLIDKLENDLKNCMEQQQKSNKAVKTQAESIRQSILGTSADKEDVSRAVMDAYLSENHTDLIDPLDIQKTTREMESSLDLLLKEIDTQVKISNATTYIEF